MLVTLNVTKMKEAGLAEKHLLYELMDEKSGLKRRLLSDEEFADISGREDKAINRTDIS